MALPAAARRAGATASRACTAARWSGSLHIDGDPVVVRVCQRRGGEVCFRAGGGDAEQRERAIERMRFALGVDDDLTEFHREFGNDPLIGPAFRRRPWIRPKRRPFAWEALAWAVTEQLIESSRAAEIQRAMVRRWGRRHRGLERSRDRCATCPRPRRSLRSHSPELQACDLSAGPLAGDDPLRQGDRRRAGRSRPSPRTTRGCSRSARSGPGRCSAWGCSAAAIPTAFPPAISPTSSSSVSPRASGAGRWSPRSRTSTRASRPSEAWQGSSH